MEKIIIIEDEAAARKELEILIAHEQGFQIVGHAKGLEEAKKLIQKQQPDLIFLDINLYDCSGFDILNAFESISGHVIFVTAYNQYAIKAIKYGALDYLLKPIDDQEFKEAIERFRQQPKKASIKQQLSLTEDIFAHQNEPQQIALPSLGQVRIVALDDILYCKGDGPYTHFFLANGKKETVSKPLKFYESLFPKWCFLRTHQSYIINTSYVQVVLNHTTIVLDNQDEIPISHRRKNEVLERLMPKR